MMPPVPSKGMDSILSQQIQPLPLITPAQSDQEYLRVLEGHIAQCTSSKLKLSLLIEYCDTGITVLEEHQDPEAENLRKKFMELPKTPLIVSKYEASVSFGGRGMAYYATVNRSDNQASSLQSSEQDHQFDLMVANELAYEATCAPFINLKLEIRTRLKMIGVMGTYDILGEMQKRLQEMTNMTSEQREMMMNYAPSSELIDDEESDDGAE